MRNALAAALSVALALSSACGSAWASEPAPAAASSSTPVPVWNRESGELEAVLWIDAPARGGNPSLPVLGTRWQHRESPLSVSVSAAIEPRYGLLCGDAAAPRTQLDDQCLVAELGRPLAPASGQVIAHAGARIGRSEWSAFGAMRRDSTEGLLPGTSLSLHTPELSALAGLPGLGFEQNDLGIVGELRLGEQGWIRVGGSIARARLLPASSMLPGTVSPRWNSRTLSVGGGYGAIGGEVVGRVVRVPGEPEGYGTLGLGLTWRTPWAGRLTVGAQNLVSTGENAVVPRTTGDEREEGRVPYVRYQQDL